MKPLGHKNYGSIPHLIGSKTGPGDKTVHEGQHRICTEKVRDKHDIIIVQEKYDGSNVGIAKKNGKILALTRSGYLANTSPYKQHHVFSAWVAQNKSLFDKLLNEGERLVGEWMYQAHGLRYVFSEGSHPFVSFDVFDKQNARIPCMEFYKLVTDFGLTVPVLAHYANKHISIQESLDFVNNIPVNKTMVVGKPEGVVYRVERKGKVDFLAKYVRQDFEPGKYLPEMSGNGPVYNCPLDQFLTKTKSNA